MTSHAGYIFTAYAFTVIVVFTLIGWSLVSYRSQKRALGDIEAKLGRSE